MPFDHDQIDNLDAVIDGLDDPTTLETWQSTDAYDAGIVAASAIRRSLAASNLLPEEWTIGPEGELTYNATDDSAGFITVQAPEGQPSFAALLALGPTFADDGASAGLFTDQIFVQGPNGTVGLSQDTISVAAGVAADDVSLSISHANPDRTADLVIVTSQGGKTGIWGVTKDGLEYSYAFTSTIDDDEIPVNSRLTYYDYTTGAPKQIIRMKDEAGTAYQRISATLVSDATAFAGVSKPSIATSPTAAAIAAALETLGLVTLT